MKLREIPDGEVSRDSGGLRTLDFGKADEVTFDLKEFLDEVYDISDVFTIFCGHEQFSYIFSFFAEKQKLKQGTARPLVYAKKNPSVMNGKYVMLNACEFAVWFKKKGTGTLNNKCKSNFYKHSLGNSKFHPTGKNIKLFTELVEDFTNEGDLVIDTCMGGGTTGVVCKQINRDFIGIELDEEYFNIAKERMGEKW